MNKFGPGVLLGAGLLYAASQVFAAPLLPGGIVHPLPVASAPSGAPIVIDSLSGDPGALNETFSWHPAGKANQASGAYINAVYVDPTTHDLDFYYQIQNTFGGTPTNQNTLMHTFTIEDYSGFTILGVSELIDNKTGPFFGVPGSAEFKGPTQDTISSVFRSSGLGTTLTVDLASPLKPGQSTAVLLVQTNVTNFDFGLSTFNYVTAPPPCKSPIPGACGFADSSPFALTSLDPFDTPTPEPGFYGMLTLGFGGLLFAARRRAARAAPLA